MKLVTSPRYEVNIGPHVFPTSKYRLICQSLLDSGEISEADIVDSVAATREQLSLVHTDEMLSDLFDLRWSASTRSSELPLSRDIVEAYVYACGGSILAARAALASPSRLAFHVGGGFHHAFAGHAEGFCYLNDIAVAIRVLQQAGEIGRAMVIDCDLHQGNGTAAIFEGDPTVFTFSIHQENNYPLKQRSDIDIGLDDFTGDEIYLASLKDFLDTHVNQFQPDLVVYVAGADPYEDDQLGALKISMQGLKMRDELVLNAALQSGAAAFPVLAGGYARSVMETVAIHAQTARVCLALER